MAFEGSHIVVLAAWQEVLEFDIMPEIIHHSSLYFRRALELSQLFVAQLQACLRLQRPLVPAHQS